MASVVFICAFLITTSLELSATQEQARFFSLPRIPSECTDFADSGQPCTSSATDTPRVWYYYDANQQRCLPFFYKGCGGTRNRFPNRTQCIRSCACYAEPSLEGCNANGETGEILYSYNQRSGSCSVIPAACAAGSDNNFQDLRLCENVCGMKPSDLGQHFSRKKVRGSSAITPGQSQSIYVTGISSLSRAVGRGMQPVRLGFN